MEQSKIRNFCIIAHIDHGKSTLADRLLEITGTVEKRKMKEQMLDQMELERERGITIKLAPARMDYNGHVLNLIDTPGHVDFTYEVSRSLAAVEGAVLLVDATQGVQAQTIANLYLAIEQNLAIIPVVNKIDLPNADVERTRKEIVALVGCEPGDVMLASGKTGAGVPEILEAVVSRVPPPRGKDSSPFRALIFDSTYDEFKGVIAFVRVVDGAIKRGEKIVMRATGAAGEALEVGYFRPQFVTGDSLAAGEIGYVVTGHKEIDTVRVGDTIIAAGAGAVEPLPGYREVKPMVFAGIFPKEGSDFERLREAMLKLRLSDSSLIFEPERSGALGFGFRIGLLGLLHLEIVQERLRREHNLELVVTTPSVAYRVFQTDGRETIIKSPADLPDKTRVLRIEEPWVKLDVVTPKQFLGGVMQLAAGSRGLYVNTEYLGGGESDGRAILHFEIPLSSILVDFYDKLKSVSSGFASMNYELLGYREAEIVRLDVLVAEEPVEALSTLVWEEDAQRIGRNIVERLKESIPKQQFEIKLQAAIGGKIIAAERVPALRKDVLAKLYGGDVTRKMKLLEKQKKGKKKMMGRGSVEIPTEAYLAVLKR
ncbi:elongation factor 4 [Candidatus Uhrbacteria bacterium RIFCSPHIGHO2_02_FULL_57_19]|uniref:Elongation factor 4 n=1 Tax=Candidatus Uhrbacteria bacterium RIFCSPHIGHO2_02_FULL_57_19 TaxID=1802391 RepID=A0A1F7U5S5_9BACT|nr:MAG: elongation factor 4 [Candidatus Uhrbacteria bacterium RIFCSPHIGHO2_02_FULL_57_19]